LIQTLSAALGVISKARKVSLTFGDGRDLARRDQSLDLGVVRMAKQTVDIDVWDAKPRHIPMVAHGDVIKAE
jgi:hypothetical protein